MDGITSIDRIDSSETTNYGRCCSDRSNSSVSSVHQGTLAYYLQVIKPVVTLLKVLTMTAVAVAAVVILVTLMLEKFLENNLVILVILLPNFFLLNFVYKFPNMIFFSP